MLKNIYIILWILFQSFAEIICQIVPSRPEERWMHTATLIDNKLYILDGLREEAVVMDELFYLDFSASFNTQSLSWIHLIGSKVVPPHFGAASANGGSNNKTLFLYGGNDNAAEFVYTFDPQSSFWDIPKITGDSATRKRHLTGIIANNGKMYLWSGFDGTTYQNDMLILDTINLSWEKGSVVDAPTPRDFYGATLLPNQSIIYMGGYDDAGKSLTLNKVHLYDTINNTWSTQETSGKVPSRDGFSAVLGLDGQSVIIFGGSTELKIVSSEVALYVLDLTNLSWFIPKISGQIPNARSDHRANVIGNYMVISFGRGYNQSSENDILLLDISNKNEFKWTNDFVLSNSSKPSSSASSISLKTSVMIGSIIGSITYWIFIDRYI